MDKAAPQLFPEAAGARGPDPKARALSDADVARLFEVTPAYVAKMRDERRWLPRRAKLTPGASGRRGVARYSFLETVAANMARTASRELGWPESEVRRMVAIINSGDEEAVRASQLVTVDGSLPGFSKVLFLAPDESDVIDAEGFWNTPDGGRTRVKARVSLIEAVEAVANLLYEKLARLGFEFSGAPGRQKPGRSA